MKWSILEKISNNSDLTFKVENTENHSSGILKKIKFEEEIQIKIAKICFFSEKTIESNYLAKVLDFYEEGEEKGIIREFVNGEKILESTEINSKNKKIDKIIQICFGLRDLHSYKFVHQKLRPNNIFITENGEVKLTDFAFFQNYKSNLTEKESVKYVSPEQCLEKVKLDFRSDFYSLGVIAFELFYGEVPFNGNSAKQIINGHLKGKVKIPKELPVQVPKNIEKIILKLLEKNPKDRYQCIFELIEDLEKVSQNETQFKFNSKLNFPKFIDRFSEQLNFEEFMESEKTVLLIKGDEGVGKSKFWENCKFELLQKEHLIFETKCSENSYDFEPFESIIFQMFSKIGDFGKKQQKDLIGKYLTTLKFISPEILKIPTIQDFLAQNPINQNILNFKESIFNFIEEFCGMTNENLLIYCEEFQLTNKKTSDLFLEFAEFFSQNNLKIVLNFASDENSFRRGFDLEKIEVLFFPSLDKIQSEDFLSSMIDKIALSINKNVQSKIFSISKGNISNSIEVFKHFYETEKIKISESETIRFANPEAKDFESLEEIFFEKISNINITAQTVLQLASIFNEKFEVSVLSELTNMKIDEIIIELEETRKLGIVDFDLETGKYFFVQQFYQNIFYKSFADEEIIELSEQIAFVSESQSPENFEEILKIARFYHKSKNYEKAFEFYSNAVEIASEEFSIFKVLQILGQAKRLPEEFLIKIFMLEFEVYFKVQDYFRAEKVLELAFKFAKKLRNSESEFELYKNIGLVYLKQKKYSEAVYAFEKCLEVSESVNDGYSIATSLFLLGKTNFLIHNFQRAEEYFLNCLNEFQPSSIPLNFLGKINFSKGKFEEAESYFEKAFLGVEIKDERTYFETLDNLFQINFQANNLERARGYVETAIEKSTQVNNYQFLATSIFDLGILQLEGEEKVDALANFEKAKFLFSELGFLRQFVQSNLKMIAINLDENNLLGMNYETQKTREICEVYTFLDELNEARILEQRLSYLQGNEEEAIGELKSLAAISTNKKYFANFCFELYQLLKSSFENGFEIATKLEILDYKTKAENLFQEILSKEFDFFVKKKLEVFQNDDFNASENLSINVKNLLRNFIELLNPHTSLNELLAFLKNETGSDFCEILVENEGFQNPNFGVEKEDLQNSIRNEKTIFKENLILMPIFDSEKKCSQILCNWKNENSTKSFSKVDLQKFEFVFELILLVLEKIKDVEKISSVSSRHFEKFVGNSKAMLNLYKEIEEAAEVDFTVYIHGQSGTGKELVAESLHNISERAKHNFVVINCASIPPNLAESELFGHEKGSFTGASSLKKGKFELSQNGTIFLDEVAELSLEIQAKLLRVIQNQEIWRVGGEEAIKINSRLVVATHKDLEEEVRKGRFREDLFHRINVIYIRVPSLKERVEDIPILAEFLLRKFANKANKKILGFTNEAREVLQKVNWKGNVRELENTIAKIVMKVENNSFVNSLHIKNLSQKFNIISDNSNINRELNKIPLEKKVANVVADLENGLNLTGKLAVFEKEVIIFELKKNGLNKSKTAESLGIDRKKLYTLIQKHKIKLKKGKF
ncbi:MAG: hypothetical protein DWQ06_12415 [Calditrichaeota bacterium]|nr:MAG: hypothetical protein DWQ06_12415 [Calditrichota bacterium]